MGVDQFFCIRELIDDQIFTFDAGLWLYIHTKFDVDYSDNFYSLLEKEEI
jgi:hypothetical protein